MAKHKSMIVEMEDGRKVEATVSGSLIVLEEDPRVLVAVVLQRLRAARTASPQREQSLAITHLEEADHWLRDLDESKETR